MTPLKGTIRVTSPYGMRTLNGITEAHNGQDLVSTDKTVRAIWNCTKTEIALGYNSGRGNLVRLYYSNTLRVICQHLDIISIKAGQTVKQGDVIGIMGNTGYSFGAHLHIEVQVLQNGKWLAVNPAQYTEVLNKVGSYPSNDTLDKQPLPEPAAPVTLPQTHYTLTIGPMSSGDKNTLEAQAEALGLKAKITEVK